MKLDDIDRRLMALVQADSSLSYAAMGAEVGLSVSAVNERVRKLERGGAVKGYVAVLDPALAGADVLAFLEVRLPPGQSGVFSAALGGNRNVQEVHRVTGGSQYLVKLRATDLGQLEAVVDEIEAAAPGPTRTRLTLVLATAKETAELPITSPGQAHREATSA